MIAVSGPAMSVRHPLRRHGGISSEPCALWLFNDFKTSSTYSTVTGVNSSRVGMSTGELGRTSSDGLAGSRTTVANVAIRSDIVALGKDLTFSRPASLFRICHWALGCVCGC